MSLDYRPVLVATAIRVVGFVTIAAFGKVRRVIFALDRRIDALAQMSGFGNLIIQVSERVSKRWLERIHNRRRNLGCNGYSIGSRALVLRRPPQRSAVFIRWMPSAALTGRAAVRPAAVDAEA